MIYTTGTIAGNGSTITGTGTNFTAAGSLIRVGCTLIAFTNPVQVLQLTAVTNGTALSVTPAVSPAIAAGTKYAILLSDSLSVDGLAQDIAETFGMYQKYMGGFSDVMNGTGDVTITINGQAVTVPGQKSVAKKGANTDITSLGGLTTALSVGQGGTGGKTQSEARAGIGLGTASTRNTGTAQGDVSVVGQFGLGGQAVLLNNADIANPITGSQLFMYGGGTSGYWTQWGAGVKLNYGGSHNFHMYLAGDDATLLTLVHNFAAGTPPIIRKHYNDGNTVVDSNGFIKRASPVVKLFHDGDYTTNDESEGIVVTRLSAGVYLIENCMGLNSDAAWGGVDGGFEIPLDRNKQPRIWLDYEIKPDGSILVKTYHRTHPDAPEFAQNKVGHKNDDGSFTETVMNGAPIDIPADQFVSVRVEMPEGSIYNQKRSAAEKERKEVERLAAEEAARKATEEAQTYPVQPHI